MIAASAVLHIIPLQRSNECPIDSSKAIISCPSSGHPLSIDLAEPYIPEMRSSPEADCRGHFSQATAAASVAIQDTFHYFDHRLFQRCRPELLEQFLNLVSR